MTEERDRNVLCAALKLARAYRALRLVQKDLNSIMDFDGWDQHLKAFKEGNGEDPQLVRRVRIKQSDSATAEFWAAIQELDKVVG